MNRIRLWALNNMVVQDLVKNYGRKKVALGCMLKIDIQKAYDTVNWNFLRKMLVQFMFPKRLVGLVMECVSTPMFSLMINGSMEGFSNHIRDWDKGIQCIPCCLWYLWSAYLEYYTRWVHWTGFIFIQNAKPCDWLTCVLRMIWNCVTKGNMLPFTYCLVLSNCLQTHQD